MTKLSINTGILLVILGFSSYFLTGAASATALIPSFFGFVFIGLGLLGNQSDSLRKHAMHGALLLAVLGLGGSFGGLINIISAIGGTMPERFEASVAQAVMAVICIIFLIAGVKSFIDARKNNSAN